MFAIWVRIYLMKALVVFLTAGALFGAVALSGAGTVPKIKQDCSICHLTHGMVVNTVLLNAPLTELCLQCHPDRKAPGEHAVGVAPRGPVGNLPLDEDGMITCITCHEPHGKTDSPRMLRAKPDRLCRYCHKM